MIRLLGIAAALLMSSLAGIAAAAENSEHPSKNAQKIIATLESVGINNKDVKAFISEANQYIDHGYLNLASRKMAGGKLTLRYQLSGGISTRQVELHFVPENSNFEGIARTNLIMVRYHLEF